MDASPHIEFRMLGGLEVRRAGASVELPPSKKTRALLAYLVLTGRQHRRDALCSLLWDVTDDPRGALRWSLSKLRKQVDDDAIKRIQTDRERVGFAAQGAHVDVLALRRDLGEGRYQQAPIELLESWSGRCSGEVLEGLDLPDFDAYQAWLVGEREETRRLRAAVLGELVSRHEAQPERALPHARAWCQADPMSTPARVAAMRLALAANQPAEAKRLYESARRLFSELDQAKERELSSAWHQLRSSPSGAPGRAEALASERPKRIPHKFSATVELSKKLATSLPLTGRDGERNELFSTVQEVARSRRAQLVLLTGEPGIGKTRLLDELLYDARTRQYAVLDGAAFEGEIGRPYGPWIDALRKLPEDRFSESARQKLAPLLEGSAETETLSRETLFSAVVEVLTTLAATRAPVIVALDDVQWLDEGSAELLHYTARMQRDLAVLFLLAARDAELHDCRAVQRVLRSSRRDLQQREIALLPLTPQATRELVDHVDKGVDGKDVHAHSGGNPLFTLELARAGGNSARAGTVADAVRDRLERLAPEAGDVLRWGAVLGAAIQPAQLARLSSLSPEAQLVALEELERHALLRHDPGQGYVFSHAIVKQVVYADLSQPRRILMHRRAAEALKALSTTHDGSVDEDLVADIARHAALAEDHALAAEAYVAAGKRCLKLSAGANASTLARRGLRHAREMADPERSQRMLELLDIQLWAQKPAGPEAFCAQVQQLAETALLHGCVEHARLGFNMLSYVRWERGDWNEAREQMLKAEQVVRTGGDEEHVAALAQAVRCLALLEHDISHAEALLAEAQVRSKQLAHESAALKDAQALMRAFSGDVEAADELFAQAQVLARNERERYAEIQITMSWCQLLFDAGRYDAALERAEEAAWLAEKTREGSEGPYARVLVALTRLALGEQSVTQQQLHESLQALRAADAKHRLAYALTRAARLLERESLHEDALTLAEEALGVARLLERSSELVLALVTRARAQRALGREEAFRETCAELSETTTSVPSAFAQRVLATFWRE